MHACVNTCHALIEQQEWEIDRILNQPWPEAIWNSLPVIHWKQEQNKPRLSLKKNTKNDIQQSVHSRKTEIIYIDKRNLTYFLQRTLCRLSVKHHQNNLQRREIIIIYSITIYLFTETATRVNKLRSQITYLSPDKSNRTERFVLWSS